jgi:hypothetical protein
MAGSGPVVEELAEGIDGLDTVLPRRHRGIDRVEDFTLDVPRDIPPFSRLLHLLVRQLLGARGDEGVVLQPKFREKGIEGLGTEIAFGRRFHGRKRAGKGRHFGPCFHPTPR